MKMPLTISFITVQFIVLELFVSLMAYFSGYIYPWYLSDAELNLIKHFQVAIIFYVKVQDKRRQIKISALIFARVLHVRNIRKLKSLGI